MSFRGTEQVTQKSRPPLTETIANLARPQLQVRHTHRPVEGASWEHRSGAPANVFHRRLSYLSEGLIRVVFLVGIRRA